MPPFGPVERRDLIHISRSLLAHILRQAGVSREEWERL